MLLIILSIFSLAALLGLFLLSYVLVRKNTPKGVAFTHGPLAALGLILLIIYSFFHSPTPITSITLFIFAALGGLMLIYRDLTGKSLPRWMALGHGLVALLGIFFLILYIF